MNIIIPSFKRSENLIGKDYFFMAKYCVPKSQEEDYIKQVGKDRIIVLPDAEDGDIIKKRNWILNNISRPLIMIDDDVKNIQFWNDRKENYLSKEFPKELLNDLFKELVNMAEQFDVKLFGLSQNQDDRQYREFLPFSLSNLACEPISVISPLSITKIVSAYFKVDILCEIIMLLFTLLSNFNCFKIVCSLVASIAERQSSNIYRAGFL